MKRNAFGQLGMASAPTYHRPFLRYFAPVEGEGGGGDGGENNGTGNGGGEFKPPASQEELNRIIADRVARAERSAREDERRKLTTKDDDPKPSGKNGDGKASDEKPSGVSEDDVDKRINEALAAERLELALERVNDGLDKALEGRTYAASKLFNLDRKQFVKEDGKTVDTEAMTKWVKENSTEPEQPDPRRRRTIPGQGDRDANATGGSVSAGRDLYDEKHSKNKSGKD
jgi:hypothetical protein